MGYFINRSLARVWVIGGIALTVVTGPVRVARAQDDDVLVEARSKFQRAIELEQAANYAGALKLFREVGAVKMTPQVRYHIATCEERLGQLVAALGGYELAMNTGEQMPEDFVADVQTSIDELKARIPKLTIERGAGAEAATIELDGVALGQTSIGIEIPLNPGPHSVVANAPGQLVFQQTITVVEGSSETLAIVMQPEVAPPPPAAPPPPVVEAKPQFGVLPYVVGGVGLGVVVLGGTLLGVSQTKVAKIKDMCDGTDCSSLDDDDKERAKELEKSARGLETAGWVSLGVGLAATGAGVVMYILDAQRKKETTATRGGSLYVFPIASTREFGLNLSGTF